MITSNLLGEKLEFIFCSMEKIWNSEEGIDIFGVNLFFFNYRSLTAVSVFEFGEKLTIIMI